MKRYGFGIDVGGTAIKMGLFTTDGELIEKWEIKTNKEDQGSRIFDDIAEQIDEKLSERNISKSEVAGIGIGVPGPVKADGTVVKCVNVGWGILNVEQELAMRTGLTVKAGNDANIAALGEMWKGGGRGCQNLLLVTLGTGVGGGIIIEGNMLYGSNGAGGEIGHVVVDKHETEVCGCKNKGCLEQYASATGVVRLAKRYMAAHSDEKLNEFGENITAKDVFDLAKEGNEGAITITKQMGNYLGKAMSHIAATVNPQAFIIGGGVSKAGSYLIDVVKDTYRETCFSACGDAAVHLAELGNDAGMFGSAALIIK